ncbi:MAG: cell wall metabolism sensor histidine kinase WalK [Defluviitaleaceae bacterium]|nr:cell wall metabolism sensor histidine kinase WalK [Defluviitaleaceae bacterium]
MSIRWKFVIICVSVVFLVMVVTGTIIIFTLRSDAAAGSHSDMRDWADEIAFHVIGHSLRLMDDDADLTSEDDINRLENSFREPFRELASNRLPIGMDAFIINASYRRTAEGTQPTEYSDRISSDVIISALVGNASFLAFRSRSNPITGDVERWFEYARPVYLIDDYTPTYIIYMRDSADDFLNNLDDITRTIFVGGIIALGAAILLIIVFSIPLTQNLLSLNKSIKSFKVGGEPITLTGANDEIGQLAESYNNMSQELNNSMIAITGEKNKMEIIMYNMSDGVLAYDGDGVLIHSNYACEELLGLSDARTMSMSELFNALNLDIPHDTDYDKIEDIIIKRGEKFVNASFNSHKNEAGDVQGLVIVLQDITKHMRLDNMRKEFVANVSHELRTPLTTIKGYAETLVDGAGDDPAIRNEFLEIINTESDRMATIIKDLLELSRFDDNRADFDFAMADLISLAKNNVINHRIMAKKQKKAIVFKTDLQQAVIRMDSDRINQVFNNIISNSLRYSHSGAKIEISIEEREHHYLVYISDTGIGIPKEDLRNIFERFYRADKARSRELGGTGLGLSIAKEIVEAHNGRIYASSELGVGTTMTLRFQKP